MFLISLLVAVAAAGTPTYLRCTFDGAKDMLVTADEANSTATVNIPSTGYMAKLPASFTPDTVQFGNRIITWSVNRVDLSARRTFDGGSADRSGRCRIETAPDRAF